MSSIVPGARRHAVEVRRAADVGRVVLPGEELAVGHGQLAPGVLALVDVRVGLEEHVATDRALHRLLHLGRRGPDVREVDRLAARGRARAARS